MMVVASALGDIGDSLREGFFMLWETLWPLILGFALSGAVQDHLAMSGVSEERQAELEHQPWATKLRSRSAWSDAASYTMADLRMLRRELALGYVIAGFLTVLVSNDVWNDVFAHGHGVWT